MQEFQEITGNPPTGCTVGLQKEDDMNVWDVHMEGPSDSLYAVSSCPSTLSLDPFSSGLGCPRSANHFPCPPNVITSADELTRHLPRRAADFTSSSRSPKSTPSNHQPCPFAPKFTTPMCPTTSAAQCAWVCSNQKSGSLRTKSRKC